MIYQWLLKKIKLAQYRVSQLQRDPNGYKWAVGPLEKYDLVAASQFNLLTTFGLREYHFLLDIGCGSLRGGKLFIPYLLTGRYFGIEPEKWLIKEGIRKEIGHHLILLKHPTFSHDTNFTLSLFHQEFNFLLAQSIFSHASSSQIRRCLSEAKKVMHSNALFFASFFEGEQNYTGDSWVYPGSVQYTMAYITLLIQEQGLVCRPINWEHPNSQTWIMITHPEFQLSGTEFCKRNNYFRFNE